MDESRGYLALHFIIVCNSEKRCVNGSLKIAPCFPDARIRLISYFMYFFILLIYLCFVCEWFWKLVPLSIENLHFC